MRTERLKSIGADIYARLAELAEHPLPGVNEIMSISMSEMVEMGLPKDASLGMVDAWWRLLNDRRFSAVSHAKKITRVPGDTRGGRVHESNLQSQGRVCYVQCAAVGGWRRRVAHGTARYVTNS